MYSKEHLRGRLLTVFLYVRFHLKMSVGPEFTKESRVNQ